jgi:hypothetical protein
VKVHGDINIIKVNVMVFFWVLKPEEEREMVF